MANATHITAAKQLKPKTSDPYAIFNLSLI